MKLKLVKKVDEARSTKSFFWQPEHEVNWVPGQYYYFTLPKLNYEDPRGNTRHITIASSPTEGNLIQITTRIREESGYKKTLDELPLDSIIEGEGPNGTFILDEKETGPQVFIAGGIGITPFRCMIKYFSDKKLSTPIYLIYSNGDSEYVFGGELRALQTTNQNFKVSFFDSSQSGHLDNQKIKGFIDAWGFDLKKATFWVSGPPPFVTAMEEALPKVNINSSQIRSEKFTGY